MDDVKSRGLSALQIKYLAMAAMFLDHVGAAVLSHMAASNVWAGTVYSIFRIIGRMAFPLFCFQLVEGFCHTGSKEKYFARLAAFAWISECPFDLAVFSKPVCRQGQNVFFTLAIGFLCIWGHSMFKTYLSEHTKNRMVQTAASCASFAVILFAGMYIADFLHTDYKFGGIMAIMAVYACRKFPYAIRCMAGCLMLVLYNPAFEIPVLLAIPVAAMYDGKLSHAKNPSAVAAKWIPYWFYPCHLFVLGCIGMAVAH